MVRLAGFAAINTAEERKAVQDSSGVETVEAQEARLVFTYESALYAAGSGRTQDAIGLLQQLLQQPLLAPGKDTGHSLQQLRFLVLKNLAELFTSTNATHANTAASAANSSGGACPKAGDCAAAANSDNVVQVRQLEALQLYGAAAMEVDDDVALWQHLAELAAQLGQDGLARYALESGLRCSPRHTLMLERLLEVSQLAVGDMAEGRNWPGPLLAASVVYRLGDRSGAADVLHRLAELDPWHPATSRLAHWVSETYIDNGYDGSFDIHGDSSHENSAAADNQEDTSTLDCAVGAGDSPGQPLKRQHLLVASTGTAATMVYKLQASSVLSLLVELYHLLSSCHANLNAGGSYTDVDGQSGGQGSAGAPPATLLGCRLEVQLDTAAAPSPVPAAAASVLDPMQPAQEAKGPGAGCNTAATSTPRVAMIAPASSPASSRFQNEVEMLSETNGTLSESHRPQPAAAPAAAAALAVDDQLPGSRTPLVLGEMPQAANRRQEAGFEQSSSCAAAPAEPPDQPCSAARGGDNASVQMTATRAGSGSDATGVSPLPAAVVGRGRPATQRAAAQRAALMRRNGVVMAPKGGPKAAEARDAGATELWEQLRACFTPVVEPPVSVQRGSGTAAAMPQEAPVAAGGMAAGATDAAAPLAEAARPMDAAAAAVPAPAGTAGCAPRLQALPNSGLHQYAAAVVRSLVNAPGRLAPELVHALLQLEPHVAAWLSYPQELLRLAELHLDSALALRGVPAPGGVGHPREPGREIARGATGALDARRQWDNGAGAGTAAAVSLAAAAGSAAGTPGAQHHVHRCRALLAELCCGLLLQLSPASVVHAPGPAITAGDVYLVVDLAGSGSMQAAVAPSGAGGSSAANMVTHRAWGVEAAPGQSAVPLSTQGRSTQAAEDARGALEHLVRYHWLCGHLHELDNEVQSAVAAYDACLQLAKGYPADWSLDLAGCSTHLSPLSQAAVEAQKEGLRVYQVLDNASELLRMRKYDHLTRILLPAAFPGDACITSSGSNVAGVPSTNLPPALHQRVLTVLHEAAAAAIAGMPVPEAAAVPANRDNMDECDAAADRVTTPGTVTEDPGPYSNRPDYAVLLVWCQLALLVRQLQPLLDRANASSDCSVIEAGKAKQPPFDLPLSLEMHGLASELRAMRAVLYQHMPHLLALSRNATSTSAREMKQRNGTDAVQIHGDEACTALSPFLPHCMIKVLRVAQQQVLAYCRLCFQLGANSADVRGMGSTSGGSLRLNQRGTIERGLAAALLEASLLLPDLQRWDPQLPDGPASAYHLLHTLLQMLSMRYAVAADVAPFLRMCFTWLTAAAKSLSAAPQSGEAARSDAASEASEESSSEENGEDSQSALLRRLHGAQAQLLYLLHGVKLEWRDADFGTPAHGAARDAVLEASKEDLSSTESCLEVWQYMAPYLGTLGEGSKELGRLRGLFERIARVVPPPPQGALAAADAAMRFLEDAGSGGNNSLQEEAVLVRALGNGTLRQVLPSGLLLERSGSGASTSTGATSGQSSGGGNGYEGRLTALSAADPLYSLHTELYHVLCCSDALWEHVTASLCSDEGAAQLEQAALLAHYDIAYNPARLSSWVALAKLYDEAHSALLDDASVTMTVAAWASHPHLAERLEVYRKRAARALLVVCSLEHSKDAAALMMESLGFLYYRSTLQQPPLAGWPHPALPRNEEYMLQLDLAYQLWQLAAAELDGEWSFQLALGKAAAKLRRAGWQALVLEHYASAAHTASLHGLPQLDPLYELHAARLKLLLPAANSRSAGPLVEADPLQLVARYPFLPSTLHTLHPEAVMNPNALSTLAVTAAVTAMADGEAAHAARPEARDTEVEQIATGATSGPGQLADAMPGVNDDIDMLGTEHEACNASSGGTTAEEVAEEAGAAAAALPPLTPEGDVLRELLLFDCLEAMRFCRDRYKPSGQYHPARSLLARTLKELGREAEALSELAPMFTGTRANNRLFAVSLVAVEDKSIDSLRKPPGRRSGRARGGGAESSGDFGGPPALDAHGRAMPSALWGIRPAKLAGVGQDELPRHFVKAVRKNLRQYLQLLSLRGELELLDAAARSLRSDIKVRPFLADMVPLTSGLHTITLLQAVADMLGVAGHLDQLYQQHQLQLERQVQEKQDQLKQQQSQQQSQPQQANGVDNAQWDQLDVAGLPAAPLPGVSIPADQADQARCDSKLLLCLVADGLTCVEQKLQGSAQEATLRRLERFWTVYLESAVEMPAQWAALWTDSLAAVRTPDFLPAPLCGLPLLLLLDEGLFRSLAFLYLRGLSTSGDTERLVTLFTRLRKKKPGVRLHSPAVRDMLATLSDALVTCSVVHITAAEGACRAAATMGSEFNSAAALVAPSVLTISKLGDGIGAAAAVAGDKGRKQAGVAETEGLSVANELGESSTIVLAAGRKRRQLSGVVMAAEAASLSVPEDGDEGDEAVPVAGKRRRQSAAATEVAEVLGSTDETDAASVLRTSSSPVSAVAKAVLQALRGLRDVLQLQLPQPGSAAAGQERATQFDVCCHKAARLAELMLPEASHPLLQAQEIQLKGEPARFVDLLVVYVSDPAAMMVAAEAFAETARLKGVNAETAEAELARAEMAGIEAGRAEAENADAARQQSDLALARAEAAKVEAMKAEVARAEAERAKLTWVQAVRSESARQQAARFGVLRDQVACPHLGGSTHRETGTAAAAVAAAPSSWHIPLASVPPSSTAAAPVQAVPLQPGNATIPPELFRILCLHPGMATALLAIQMQGAAGRVSAPALLASTSGTNQSVASPEPEHQPLSLGPQAGSILDLTHSPSPISIELTAILEGSRQTRQAGPG